MLAIAVLAAGKGTRMKSNVPKVLQELGGISLIERILQNCNKVKPDRQLVIIGHQAEIVKDSLQHYKNIEFVKQMPQKGTGHAVQQLLPILNNFEGELLILNGDVPLLKSSTIKKLIKYHRHKKANVTFLSTRKSSPKGYGRVFIDQDGYVSEIIEESDCTTAQKLNTLINAGIYCFNWKELAKILKSLVNNNAQNEIYLTDTISHLTHALHLEVDDPNEVNGINDRIQLAECERIIQTKLKDYWMNNGVSFIDPSSCSISERSVFGIDVTIEPQTHIRGKCIIGNNCLLGPGTLIENSEIGMDSSIVYSVVRNSMVGENVKIGPFSHIRPKVQISDGCKVGNFVELKNSLISKGTNISHLSYVGDSTIGKSVNIGAGTITANFDGTKKSKSIIGDNVKTGANSVLVAPIKIGSNVVIGAGSTITKNIPAGSLAVERSKTIIKEDWVKN